MQWADVTRQPTPRLLRQFAGLWIVFFVGLAAWRWWEGQVDGWTAGLAAAGLVVGSAGLFWPPAIRPVFTAWMIAAFPIGWTVSTVALAAVFYLVFTPVAWALRLIKRDVLGRRQPAESSFWIVRTAATRADEYFRQS